MKKPIIGITCNTQLVDGAVQPGIERTFVNSPYVTSVMLAGGIPLLLPPVTSPEVASAQMAAIDGLILSGGPDINPLLYKEEPSSHLGIVNHPRDEYETALLTAADSQKKPILGICRGIQMLNVFYGGTLYQDLSAIEGCTIKHMQSGSKFDALWHSVEIVPASLLSQIFGKTDITVNSYHHQALKDIAPGFTVSAKAKDHVIEAIERQGGHFVLGVQWHPELLTEKYRETLPLFEALIKHA